MIDIATLTGACMVALGKDITGFKLNAVGGLNEFEPSNFPSEACGATLMNLLPVAT